jgi:nicotinamidase-related amidase
MPIASNHHRALVVIDVQNDYDGGNLPIEYPPFRDTVAKVAAAMDFAAAAGIRIVVVRQMAPATSPIFAAGSHGGELHPAIAGRPSDHAIEKSLPSAFAGTDLDTWLRQAGITTLTITGYMTHNCDLSTAIDATQLDYRVELLSDATGSVPYSNRAGFASAEEIHRVMLVVMQARFAGIGTLAEWRQAVESGTALEIEGIAASNRAAREAARAA